MLRCCALLVALGYAGAATVYNDGDALVMAVADGADVEIARLDTSGKVKSQHPVVTMPTLTAERDARAAAAECAAADRTAIATSITQAFEDLSVQIEQSTGKGDAAVAATRVFREVQLAVFQGCDEAECAVTADSAIAGFAHGLGPGLAGAYRCKFSWDGGEQVEATPATITMVDNGLQQFGCPLPFPIPEARLKKPKFEVNFHGLLLPGGKAVPLTDDKTAKEFVAHGPVFDVDGYAGWLEEDGLKEKSVVVDASKGFNGVRFAVRDVDSDDAAVAVSVAVAADPDQVVVAGKVELARVGNSSSWTLEFPDAALKKVGRFSVKLVAKDALNQTAALTFRVVVTPASFQNCDHATEDGVVQITAPDGLGVWTALCVMIDGVPFMKIGAWMHFHRQTADARNPGRCTKDFYEDADDFNDMDCKHSDAQINAAYPAVAGDGSQPERVLLAAAKCTNRDWCTRGGKPVKVLARFAPGKAYSDVAQNWGQRKQPGYRVTFANEYRKPNSWDEWEDCWTDDSQRPLMGVRTCNFIDGYQTTQGGYSSADSQDCARFFMGHVTSGDCYAHRDTCGGGECADIRCFSHGASCDQGHYNHHSNHYVAGGGWNIYLSSKI